MGESREENGHTFVAEEAFAEDLDESVTFIGFIRGQIEQGGLTFGLGRGGLGAEVGLLGFIRDEFAGQVDDVGAGSVGCLKVEFARSDAERVTNRRFPRLAVERLLQVEGHRDVTCRKAKQVVAFIVEVLPLVDERDVEEGMRGSLAQPGQQSLADQAEIWVPFFIDRRCADEFHIAKPAPVVKGQHRFIGQSQFRDGRAQEIPQHVGVDQYRDLFRSTRA